MKALTVGRSAASGPPVLRQWTWIWLNSPWGSGLYDSQSSLSPHNQEFGLSSTLRPLFQVGIWGVVLLGFKEHPEPLRNSVTLREREPRHAEGEHSQRPEKMKQKDADRGEVEELCGKGRHSGGWILAPARQIDMLGFRSCLGTSDKEIVLGNICALSSK